MSDIFISHATADDEIVTRIHDHLERETGREMWVDHKDIQAGDEWQSAIETALQVCPDLLLVVSKTSMQSKEVLAEWRAALTYGHRVLLAIIDDIPIEQIPSRLRLIQWVDVYKDWDGGMAKLVGAIVPSPKDQGGESDYPQFRSVPITGLIDRRLTVSPLRGREEDLKKIKAHLKTAPTCIVGVGGLGKSRLAVEIALTSEDVQGVIWHRVTEFSRDYDVIAQINEHFDLPSTTERRETLNKLKTARRLIVLDNAEDVPPDDPRYADYVKLANELFQNKGQVLLTSRVEWEALKPMKKHEPSALLTETARQIVLDMGATYEVSGLESYADEIARDGMYHPRLIEWAVEQMNVLPRSEVLSDLKSLRSEDAQGALEEMVGKTLQRMIDSSPKGELAARALERLVVCRGGFTFEAADAIALDGETLTDKDDLHAALKTLTIWRFIRFEVQSQRYTIPLIVFAVVKADESAYSPHYDYYFSLANSYSWGHDHLKYFKMYVERENYDAAFKWAMKTEEWEKAYWIANVCSDFLSNRGRFDQFKDWLEQVAEKVTDSNTFLWAALQNSLGILYQTIPIGNRYENLQKSTVAFENALEYWHKHEYEESFVTYNNLGNTYSAIARLEPSIEAVKLAIICYDKVITFLFSSRGQRTRDARRRYGQTLHNLANVLQVWANLEERVKHLNDAIYWYKKALPHRIAGSLEYAMTQHMMGDAYKALAATEDREINIKYAIDAYTETLIYWTAETAPLEYATTQKKLGEIYEELGDFSNSTQYWREAEKYYRQVGMIVNADEMLEWIADAEGRLSAGDEDTPS